MKSFLKYVLSRKLVLVICLFYFFVRTISLDLLFLSRDERDLSLTGYSIAKTGNDLFGNRMPFKFERISPNSPVIPVYYDALWWRLPLEKSVTNARLAFVLPASLLPLLAYELILLMTRKKGLSLLAAMVFSFSPWMFHVSRMALEINLALPFTLLAAILQIQKKRLPSFLFYFLAFFSYQGFRPLLMILPSYFELYMYYIKKEDLKSAANSSIKYLLAVFLLIFISGFLESGMSSRSTNEIIFFNSDKVKQEIDFSRSVSTAHPFLKPIFINKATIVSGYLANNLLAGLDFSYLFMKGDYDPKYANGIAGQFPFIALPLFLLGIWSLTSKAGAAHFLAGLALVGLIPGLINTYSLTFSIRGTLAALGFSFLISSGVMRGYELMRKTNKSIRNAVFAIFIMVSIFQLASFYHKYFTSRYGLQSELFQEADRKVSLYLNSVGKKYTVVSPLPYQTLMAHIFITPTNNLQWSPLNKMLRNKYDNFVFKGNTFKSCDAVGYFNPEEARNMIISETCVSGEKKPYLKKKNLKTISYSSYTPNKHEELPAFYIFED